MPPELQLLIEGLALRRPPPTIATVHRQAAGQQHQPAEDPDHEQVEQAKKHKPRSCRNRLIRPNRRSQHLRRVLKRYKQPEAE